MTNPIAQATSGLQDAQSDLDAIDAFTDPERYVDAHRRVRIQAMALASAEVMTARSTPEGPR